MNEALRNTILSVDDRLTHATVTWLDTPGAPGGEQDATDGRGHGRADDGTPQDGNTVEEDAYLVAAMASAALAAAQARIAFAADLPLNDRKVRVDGAATEAAEKILHQAPFRIRVAAGEGERDDSPGAHSGQWLGVPDDTSPVVDGVFDYVDGTELAANGHPGALTLGGFGNDVRPVPDLQAFAVLAPRELLDELDIMSRPEDCVVPVLHRIAELTGKRPDSLTVSTHTIGSKPMHQTLVDLMRGCVREVLVPERVTVEPPYLLSLVGLSEPRIDSMIGAIGLSELAFAAGLVDLIAPGLGFVFRPASISGPRAEPHLTSLDALYRFSEDEEAALRSGGWDKDRQYTSKDLVRPGTSRAAALFAVTDNPALGLRGPSPEGDDVAHVEGFLIKQAAKVGRIRLGYRR
ncbi:fructose-bisphosphatase class II [Streptomyces sp. Li-HN-5-11]|uniref:fructose-bisphosphatase class II n=1 Tax=Streptomyces sp. Li-HN-5-11 TaxID=3075432 RepID=UPI0028A6385B|nr:fructose-bisphosphatase class II [Streptomyces sp. Li-HN-5-11]WNM35525.1 fructose-bisphosphatase class II [Streptomyces sp. Li-HN-5-11]